MRHEIDENPTGRLNFV
uniref:Uncharacterized protein n=1 Tax=Arundo donax TaxID=35708 RepID=A0A0A9A0S1_ARUDO